ncbi:MAG: KTSC domain-containing protein [Alphaproteobacteria bacterium]|nr:KTSC domain-containing protein [Alphaproteobacteria bacterium]
MSVHAVLGDSFRRELVIVFQTGRIYSYADVPVETYAAMKAALSKGEFVNLHIRDKFTFTRKGDASAA